MIIKTLGTFTVEAQIGKGGMGEVYRAKDQKLGRDVAIKVLPEEFAKDSDRVARFQREAKLLASLNHPNIAAIYGLEESKGTHFLVLELIEGDTLADRIKGGPIPVEEALKLALQIAEALEAAHEKGVIHRDLKPANIKVTPDGKVKVLDFGLAKAFAGEQAEVNLSHSPTLSEAATLQGVILGTAAYMSPEQARGKPVDKQTDIWAFGCVLFEMLTGKAAFQGEDVTEILAAVVKSGVNLDLLPANIHPRVREVIIRCLQKEQKKRYPEINQALYEIEQTLSDPSGIFAQSVTAIKPRKKVRIGLPWFVAAALLCVIIGGLVVWMLKPTEPPRIMRFDYELPENQQFFRMTDGNIPLAVSPDGSQFVYGTTKGLYLRSLDEMEAKPIAGTDEDSQSLFFSPDGQWIGYFSMTDQKLKKISINGGTAVVLCDAAWAYGGHWYSDNTIVYSDAISGIYRVSADGGTPELLIKGMTVMPKLMPDGKSVMYLDVSVEPYRTVVQSLESEEREFVFEGLGTYLPTGHFIYFTDDGGYAVSFDFDKREFAGGPVPLREGGLAYSESGTLAYISGGSGGRGQVCTLVWVDREGNEESLGAEPNAYGFFKISPDGTRVAINTDFVENDDIYIWDIARKIQTKLTFDGADDNGPLWTPDGQRIVFTSFRDGGLGGIYVKNADGTGETDLLFSIPDRYLFPWSWSADGKILLAEATTTPLSMDIGVLSIEGDPERELILQEEHLESDPRISPDGKWLAYTFSESGQAEIYVRPFPDVHGGQWKVSNNGGISPLWSPDGRELFYRNGDAIMAVDVETEPTFKPGNPRVLFNGSYFTFGLGQIAFAPWDISPDGKRFLMPKEIAGDDPSQQVSEPKINIVINWFEDLRKRVPIE